MIHLIYVGGSSKIQTFMSHDSNSIRTEVYNNGLTGYIVKLLFFIYKSAGVLLTSIYIYINVSHTHIN